MKRDLIDFNEVSQAHQAIHARLLNWAQWCRGTSGGRVSPMFRLYRPTKQEREPYLAPIRTMVDAHDAAKIAKAVIALPLDNRLAVQWWYVIPQAPRRMCQRIGCTMAGLDALVRQGRQMLVNRGA
jgi:hypothetical protein